MQSLGCQQNLFDNPLQAILTTQAHWSLYPTANLIVYDSVAVQANEVDGATTQVIQ